MTSKIRSWSVRVGTVVALCLFGLVSGTLVHHLSTPNAIKAEEVRPCEDDYCKHGENGRADGTCADAGEESGTGCDMVGDGCETYTCP
jgi:hypothetical protein